MTTTLEQPNVTYPRERAWAQQFRWTRYGNRWRIEGSFLNGASWSASSFELFKLLHGAGMTLREASAFHLEWTAPGCDLIFRGVYDHEHRLWALDSKEWGGSRWIACDDRTAQVALGGKARAA